MSSRDSGLLHHGEEPGRVVLNRYRLCGGQREWWKNSNVEEDGAVNDADEGLLQSSPRFAKEGEKRKTGLRHEALRSVVSKHPLAPAIYQGANSAGAVQGKHLVTWYLRCWPQWLMEVSEPQTQ